MKQPTAVLLGTLLALASATQAQTRTAFEPGQVWPDNKGTHLNAHGAGVLYDQGRYYMYGEHKIAGPKGNSAQVGVHCYSSQDLYNWQDEGIALAVAADERARPRPPKAASGPAPRQAYKRGPRP